MQLDLNNGNTKSIKDDTKYELAQTYKPLQFLFRTCIILCRYLCTYLYSDTICLGGCLTN